MELQTLTAEDLPLYESLYCDPWMMTHLGGAWEREGLPEKLRRDLERIEAGTAWIYKVVVFGTEGMCRTAGLVCIWEHVWRGEPVTEVGWMILPGFQGKGLGTRAVSDILDKARREGRWRAVQALPATTNPASNAICRKLGFTLVEECDLEFKGHALRCNYWRLDLRSTP